jgi:hypothetical protein
MPLVAPVTSAVEPLMPRRLSHVSASHQHDRLQTLIDRAASLRRNRHGLDLIGCVKWFAVCELLRFNRKPLPDVSEVTEIVLVEPI